MPPSEDKLPEHVGRCVTCGSPLAPDQRYCLECGTRRHPISDSMRRLIYGAVPAASAATAAAAAEQEAALAEEPLVRLPHPRAIAVAVVGLLAFGVMIGSV